MSTSKTSCHDFISKLGSGWLVILDEALGNYVEDDGDDVVGCQQQSLCGVQSNANNNLNDPSSLALSIVREVVSVTPCMLPTSHGSKGRHTKFQNSKNMS